MDLPNCILFDPAVVACTALIVAADNDAIRLEMAAVQPVAACPVCGTDSHRIHSCYQRHLADLPWAQVTMTIDLAVRRFFCNNGNCSRRIFTERLANIAAP